MRIAAPFRESLQLSLGNLCTRGDLPCTLSWDSHSVTPLFVKKCISVLQQQMKQRVVKQESENPPANQQTKPRVLCQLGSWIALLDTLFVSLQV